MLYSPFAMASHDQPSEAFFMAQPPHERTTGLLDLFRHFRLEDLLTTRLHSRDFTFYRSDYILVRVMLFALLFGVATPLWIPVDHWLLPIGALGDMAALRGVAAALFLVVAFTSTRHRTLAVSRLALVALIAIPAAFYCLSRLILGDQALGGALIGYTFLPFVLIAGGALFPVTVLESIGLMAVVYAAVLTVEVYLGTLLTLSTLGTLWLMLLLSGITILAQTAQLHMLLGLYRQATRDPLTGLFNRRALFRQAQAELARTDRHGRPLAVALIDLDRFKRINDRYGHPVGDEVLAHLSEILQAEIREEDLLGRYGGEEFMVVLPDTGADGARQLADRIRTRVAASPADTASGEIPLTASVGLAEWKRGESLEDLMNRADGALYRAKEEGRDRVVYLEELPPDLAEVLDPLPSAAGE
jgi:diguanylate cyclase (GGDEF)-like protein